MNALFIGKENYTFAALPSHKMNSLDKASAEYWSDVWTNSPLNPPIDYTSNKSVNYFNRILHQIYSTHLAKLNPQGKTMLEVGCGNSSWMTYFAKAFGMNVSGIDYSEKGCEQSQKILERDQVKGNIYFGDVFHPPAEVPHDFDFVYSGGVVEHFEDTTAAVKAFSSFLKKGGIMITSLPNMPGITGVLHKAFNKPVYDTHVPLTKDQIVEAHRKAGLEVIHSQYYGSVSMYINLESVDGKKVSLLPLKKFLTKFLSVLSMGIWRMEKTIGILPATAFFAPGIMVIAKKL